MKFDKTMVPDLIGNIFLLLEQILKFDLTKNTPKLNKMSRYSTKFVNNIKTLCIFDGFSKNTPLVKCHLIKLINHRPEKTMKKPSQCQTS